jgi:hypothetical protein
MSINRIKVQPTTFSYFLRHASDMNSRGLPYILSSTRFHCWGMERERMGSPAYDYSTTGSIKGQECQLTPKTIQTHCKHYQCGHWGQLPKGNSSDWKFGCPLANYVCVHPPIVPNGYMSPHYEWQSPHYESTLESTLWVHTMSPHYESTLESTLWVHTMSPHYEFTLLQVCKAYSIKLFLKLHTHLKVPDRNFEWFVSSPTAYTVHDH